MSQRPTQKANNLFKETVSRQLISQHAGYQTSYYLTFKDNKFSYSLGKQNFGQQEELLKKSMLNYLSALQKTQQPTGFYRIGQMPESTFISGLGQDHVTETGIDVHTTYGVPYIRGTALKGILSYWTKEAGVSEEHREQIFGREERIVDDYRIDSTQGEVIFHDVFFEKFKFNIDIMNPHFLNYHEGNILSEQKDPRPVNFITVSFPEKSTGALSLVKESKLGAKDLSTIMKWLDLALREIGIGSKTAIGHGRFQCEEITEINDDETSRE